MDSNQSTHINSGYPPQNAYAEKSSGKLHKRIINTGQRGLQPLPTIADIIPKVEADLDDFLPSTDGISGLTLAEPELFEVNFDGAGWSRKFDVLGVHHGQIKETITVGRQVTTASFHIHYMGYAGSAPGLIIQPATAAVAAPIKDKNFVAAIAAINSLFAVGNEPKIGNSMATPITKLLTMAPAPHRLFFNFARIWLYKKLFENQFSTCDTGIGRSNNARHLDSLSSVAACMQFCAAGGQALVLDVDLASFDPVKLISACQVATGQYAYPPHIGAISTPSVVTSVLGLPEITVFYKSSYAVTTTDPALSANDMWSAAEVLACQWGATHIWKDCVGAVLSLAYSSKPGADEIFSAPTVTVPLPNLALSHYGLLPLAIANNTLDDVTASDEILIGHVASKLGLRNQLLSICMCESLFQNEIYSAVSFGYSEARFTSWQRRLITSQPQSSIPLLTQAMSLAKGWKMGVSLGTIMSLVRPRYAEQFLINVQRSWSLATQWEEVFDVMPDVPAPSLHALTRPQCSQTLLQPGIYYRLAELGPSVLNSQVDALERSATKLVLASRQVTEINYTLSTVQPCHSYRGCVADHPIPKLLCNKYEDQNYLVVNATASGVLNLFSGAEVKYDWKWYLSGSGFSLQPPISDDSTGHTPPNMFALQMEPVSNVTITPNPVRLDSSNQLSGTPSIHSTQRPTVVAGVKAGADQFPTHNDATVANLASELASQQEAKIKNLEQELGAVAAAALPIKLPVRWQVVVEQAAKIAPGLVRDAVMTYVNVNTMPVPTGHTQANWFGPFVTPIAMGLSDVNLAAAIASVPIEQRVGVAHIIENACRGLLAFAGEHQTVSNLSRAVHRAHNLSSALAQCPALTLNEITEMGLVTNTEAKGLISDYGNNALESGIPLSSYTATATDAIDTKLVGADDTEQWICKGWKVNRNQAQVAPGKVIMHYKHLPAYPRLHDAVACIIERSESVEQAVAADLLKYLAPAGLDVGREKDPFHPVGPTSSASLREAEQVAMSLLLAASNTVSSACDTGIEPVVKLSEEEKMAPLHDSGIAAAMHLTDEQSAELLQAGLFNLIEQQDNAELQPDSNTGPHSNPVFQKEMDEQLMNTLLSQSIAPKPTRVFVEPPTTKQSLVTGAVNRAGKKAGSVTVQQGPISAAVKTLNAADIRTLGQAILGDPLDP